jgi:hypothetical protein
MSVMSCGCARVKSKTLLGIHFGLKVSRHRIFHDSLGQGLPMPGHDDPACADC